MLSSSSPRSFSFVHSQKPNGQQPSALGQLTKKVWVSFISLDSEKEYKLSKMLSGDISCLCAQCVLSVAQLFATHPEPLLYDVFLDLGGGENTKLLPLPTLIQNQQYNGRFINQGWIYIDCSEKSFAPHKHLHVSNNHTKNNQTKEDRVSTKCTKYKVFKWWFIKGEKSYPTLPGTVSELFCVCSGSLLLIKICLMTSKVWQICNQKIRRRGVNTFSQL